MKKTKFTKRPAAKRAAVAYLDLHDQPVAKYYLLIDWGIGGKSTFQVDGVWEQGHSILGYINVDHAIPDQFSPVPPNQEIVIQFNKDIPWTMVSANYAQLTTLEDIVRREAEDEKQVRALMNSVKNSAKNELKNGDIKLPENVAVDAPKLYTGHYV